MTSVVLHAHRWVDDHEADEDEDHRILYVSAISINGLRFSDLTKSRPGRIVLELDGASDFLSVTVYDPPPELRATVPNPADYLLGTDEKLILGVTSLAVDVSTMTVADHPRTKEAAK